MPKMLRYNPTLKRILDIAVALIVFILFSPLLAV